MKDKSSGKHGKTSFKEGFEKESREKICQNSKGEQDLERRVEKEMNGLHKQLFWSFEWGRNSTFVPEEMRLKKKMVALGERIVYCQKDGERTHLLKQFSLLSQQYHFCMEYNGRINKFKY